jgi:hypothetical protein
VGKNMKISWRFGYFSCHGEYNTIIMIVYSKIFLNLSIWLFFALEIKKSLALQGCVPSLQVWAIAQVVVNILGPMVQQCVLNQRRGYEFLLDALVVAVSLVCQFHCLDLILMKSKILMGSSRSFGKTCKNKWYQS